MQTGYEIAKRVSEIEKKFKEIEEELKKRPLIVAINFYERELERVMNELSEIENTESEIRRYALPKTTKIENLEKNLKSIGTKKEKLKKSLDESEKKVKDIEKEKDKKKFLRKIYLLRKDIYAMEQQEKILTKHIEVSKIDLSAFKTRKQNTINEKNKILAKINELSTESKHEVVGDKKCAVCGSWYIGERCSDCGAKVIEIGLPIFSPKEVSLFVKYGPLFLIIGMIVVVLSFILFR